MDELPFSLHYSFKKENPIETRALALNVNNVRLAGEGEGASRAFTVLSSVLPMLRQNSQAKN